MAGVGTMRRWLAAALGDDLLLGLREVRSASEPVRLLGLLHRLPGRGPANLSRIPPGRIDRA